MKKFKKKLIVIVGPTASGKSELALKLAKKINGEIISADSRQIYRGLDIGTGKITKREQHGIPHYLLDVVNPKASFAVADFKQRAEKTIHEIAERGKISILVGGTGFWIDAVVYNLAIPRVPPNKTLRRALEKKTTGELLRILKKLDPKRAKTIEQKNPRRLIRAIEIARALGHVPKLKKHPSIYNVLWLGVLPSYETWSHRIKNRVKSMISRGLVRETKNLLKKGVSKKRIREFGFEYRTALNYIEKKITKKELYQYLVKDTLEYARRQMTWFKRNPNIQWIYHQQHAEKIVKSFLTKI